MTGNESFDNFLPQRARRAFRPVLPLKYNNNTTPSMICVISYIRHKNWLCGVEGMLGAPLSDSQIQTHHKRSRAQLITGHTQPWQWTPVSRLVVVSDSSGSVDTRGCWSWWWWWCRGRSGGKHRSWSRWWVCCVCSLESWTAAHISAE